MFIYSTGLIVKSASFAIFDTATIALVATIILLIVAQDNDFCRMTIRTLNNAIGPSFFTQNINTFLFIKPISK